MFSLSIALCLTLSTPILSFSAAMDKKLWYAVALRIIGALGIVCLSLLEESQAILLGTTGICLVILAIEGLLTLKGPSKQVRPSDALNGGGRIFRDMEVY